MDIQGYYKGFVELAEVFQTLFAQEKSGVLHITEDKTQKIVTFQFQRGKISGAHFDKEERESYFWNYLVRAGSLSPQDFNELKMTQMKRRRPFEGGLVESKIITTDGLRHMAHFYIQSVIDRLFTWDAGSYRFESQGQFQPFILSKVALDIQPLTMEAVRRKDEWPQVEKNFSEENLIILRKKEPADSTEGIPEEKRILELVNGRRTLKDISEASGLGFIGTYHTIYHLFEAGFVEKGGIKAPKVRVTKRPRLTSILQGIRESPYWLGFTLFLVVTVMGGIVIREQVPLEWGRLPLVSSSVILLDLQKEQILALLDQYYLREGSYPEQLEDLSSLGWIARTSLHPFSYHVSTKGPLLEYKSETGGKSLQLLNIVKQYFIK
jgi:hypothetical protein